MHNKFRHLYRLLCITIFTLSVGYPAYSDNLYDILEIDKSASQQEVKSAYRKLSKQTHPDLNPDDPEASKKFIRVTNAYKVLSDSKKRQIYDKTGSFSEGSSHTEADERHERAIKRAMESSNSVWTFDPESVSFYDNRTGVRSYRDTFFGSYKTKDNWIFDPDRGTYEDYDVRMKWNPSNDKGWLRDTSNFNNKPLPINPKNGFVRYLKYEPGTVSDLSEKFDQLLNPLLVMRDQRGLYDRTALVKELTGTALTEAQEIDLMARANSSIDILIHKDMKPNFATDGMYVDAFLTAIASNSLTMDNPAVIYRLMREAKNYHAEKLAKIIINDGWLNHEGSDFWLKAAMANTRVGQSLIIETYKQEGLNKSIVDMKEKVFSALVRAQAGSKVINQFIYSHIYDEDSKSKKLNALENEFNQLVSFPSFAQLIAEAESEKDKDGEESRSTTGLIQFLEWYKSVNSSIANTYLDALGIAGVHKRDYWKITEDRTKWYTDEKAYEEAFEDTRVKRIDYLSKNLPIGFLKWPENKNIIKPPKSSCKSSLK